MHRNEISVKTATYVLQMHVSEFHVIWSDIFVSIICSQPF